MPIVDPVAILAEAIQAWKIVISTLYGSEAMADAQIQQELTNLRAIVETMRGDQQKLRERDDMMATRLDQADKAITARVTVLEAAYV